MHRKADYDASGRNKKKEPKLLLTNHYGRPLRVFFPQLPMERFEWIVILVPRCKKRFSLRVILLRAVHQRNQIASLVHVTAGESEVNETWASHSGVPTSFACRRASPIQHSASAR